MKSHYEQSKSFQPIQSDTFITPDQIYQTLIRQTPNLYPLCKFKTKGTMKPLFPDAVKYPEFFNYNLVSPGRVIKKLEGPESIVKGFYYQLMKLAFEIQIEDKDYIDVLRNVIFSPEFMLEENPSSPSSGKNYSDLQYKKIVAEFMQILMRQSIPNFQLTILSYPIVDQAMVKILQNLLKFKGSVEIPLNPSISSFEILSFLSQIFQITVHQYGSCFKFQQSDIFFYEHSKNEYYIAFLNEMAEMSDATQSSRRRDSSNYQPVSSKKIVQLDEKQDDEEYSAKKARKTHQYLNSQFDIETPAKQPTRQCLSNPPQSKTKSDKKNHKNYRNTIGSHLIRINEEPTRQIPPKQHLENQEKNLKTDETKNPRESRQSIINQLHQLVHQTQQIQIHDNQNIYHEYNQTNKLQIPHVPLAKSISQPTQALYEYDYSKMYQLQSNKVINQPAKYQYQPKGYTKKIDFDESSKFLVKSAQSDEVIGYSELAIGSSKGQTNLNPSSNSLLSNNYLSKPFQSNLNIHLQTKKYTINKPKEIEQLGLIGNGKTNSFNPDLLQQKYKQFGINHQPHLTENKNLPRFNQEMPLLNNSKTNLSSNITAKITQTTTGIFYSPKPLISKPTFIEHTNIYKSPLKNQQSLGTLYRQFSDTKVLDILPQEMQNNIRRMRRKYKGVHSKDFFGINRF